MTAVFHLAVINLSLNMLTGLYWQVVLFSFELVSVATIVPAAHFLGGPNFNLTYTSIFFQAV